MFVAETAVKRRVTFIMLYIAAVGFGIYSLIHLKLDMYPDISFPLVVVITQYDGAAPEDIEELVTRPIEEGCAAVKGVEKIESDSKYNVSVVYVEFKWGTDIDQAKSDIHENIDMVRDNLPSDAKEPLVFSFDPSLEPILFFGVSGPYDQARLRDISVRQIEPQIERLPGVAAAETIGGLEREIQVRIRPEQLRAVSLSPQLVVDALRMENVQIPGGSLVYGQKEYSILPEGQFTSVDQIREIPVAVRGQAVIRLKDVADVVDTFQDITRYIHVNEKPGIMLMVRKQSGENSVESVKAVLDDLPNITARLPRGVRLNKIFSQADFIQRSIGNLSESSYLAVIITMLVLLVFLRRLTPSLIVASAIPISIIITFAAMDRVGMSLNIISFAGLALSVGMLVDNSIVVLESIYRHVELGAPPHEAAVKGTNEVDMAITASTLTSIAVFAPVLLVPGIAGALFRDMAMTICFSHAISLIVALTLVPLLCSIMLEKDMATSVKKPLGAAGKIFWVLFFPLTFPWWILKTYLGPFLAKVSLSFLNAVNTSYVYLLNLCMRWRVTTVVVSVAALAAAILVLVFYVGTDYFPDEDQGMMLFQLKAEVGTDVETTEKYMKQAVRILRERTPEAEVVASDVGTGEGFAAMFAEGSHAGVIRVRLSDMAKRKRSQQDIEKDLRKAFRAIPGATVDTFMPFNITGGADLEIKIVGHDLDTAKQVGQKVMEIVKKDPDAADTTFSMTEGRPEYHVVYDRERLAALGLPAAIPSSVISTFFQGTIATLYREKGDEYYVRVKAPRELRHDRRTLENLLVMTPTGKSVPLSSIARIESKLGPIKITRKDQKRVVTVSASSVGQDLGGFTKRIKKQLDAFQWPEGFSYMIGGGAEDFMESFQYLGLALLAALLLVFMVMASQFESLLEPFIIFLTIPFSVIGAAIALVVTGIPISIMAIIGEIVLVGIVTNNSIVLVDCANQRIEKDKMDYVTAVIAAGKMRLRPILMTALTTALGMIPLALVFGSGAEEWAPLARVIIGGLLLCTFVTLLVVPIFYIWFVGLTKRGKASLAGKAV